MTALKAITSSLGGPHMYLISCSLCAVLFVGCTQHPTDASVSNEAKRSSPKSPPSAPVIAMVNVSQKKEGFTIDLHALSLEKGANGYIYSAAIKDADLVKLANSKEGKHYPLSGATF